MKNNEWVTFWVDYGKHSKGEDSQTQVLRTINKEPISNEKWEFCLNYIKQQICLEKADDVLELCSGNGLIAQFLAPNCKSITAVDVSKDLLNGIDISKHPNIICQCQDIRELKFPDGTFSKIIIYAGIQYLSLKEIVLLFEEIVKWLKPGGIFFIGDIPDIDRRWTFFNSTEREAIYFNTVKEDKDIIGTWLDKQWLMKLSKFVGFKYFEIIDQHPDMICFYYRFDIKISN